MGSSQYSHRSLGRKQILDSKSYKRLQELNLALNKQAILLDDERTILAATLQDYLAGATLEQVLRELCTELTELEAQDVALHQQITYEFQKLDQLEQKVRGYSLVSRTLILSRTDRTDPHWRRFQRVCWV